MSDKTKAVIVDKISKNYVMGNSVVKVFDDFSLSVSSGETVAVTGPSGSGASGGGPEARTYRAPPIQPGA